MSRYAPALAGANSQTDGDTAFRGVDMRRDPTALEPGLCSLAVNRVFRLSEAQPRTGFQTRVWAEEKGKSFPWDFPVSFTQRRGFGRAFGATLFSDPYGQEFMLVACEKVAYRLSANAPISVVKYPGGLTVDGPVTFTQAFNVLLMWRGKNASTWQFSTGTDFSQDFQFEEVADETNEDYTSTIPRAERATAHGQRIWVALDDSRVAFSDLLNYTRYDADFSEIFVNSGSNDVLVALVPFGENALLAFKDKSIYAINGILPNPQETAVLQKITGERGTIAPDSPVQVGKDIWFLSDNGVYAISQALDNKLQAGAEAISAPLQPLFDRVNWDYAHLAQATFADNKYFLALPIDSATHNNAIVVFDFLNGTWAGWWECAWLDVLKFLRPKINGQRRLAIVSGNALDRTNHGCVFVLGEGYQDERFGEFLDIETTFRTRGYTAGSTLAKQWQAALVDVATWHGAGTIRTIRDGVNEEGAAQAFEKDRTRYYTFGKAPYDTSNANDDHGAPYREDYSVGAGVFTPGANGIAFGLHQKSSERMRLRERARALQLEITGTRGRVSIRSATVALRDTTAPLREEA